MISYIGGKNRMAKWIGNYIPNDIETYVEVFGGAFWVYVNGQVHKKPILKNVIYNDFNRYMTNLFACCRNPQEFLKSMDEIVAQDSELFYQFKTDVFENKNIKDIDIPDYDYGMKYAYIVTQIFSGLNPEKGKFIDLKGKYSSKFDAFRRRLKNPAVIEKLKKISNVENMDFEEVIKKYDSPTTYFYVDPPYWKTENYYSLHNFDTDDHKILADILKNIEGRFSLSYYDFDQLHDWFPEDEYEWELKDFVKPASAQKGKSQNKGTELLIMNYQLENKKEKTKNIEHGFWS
ncbi:DNA adenine methylase [Candidatus Woesearchaeota archaeon]|nr:DNA adenine methylase [Candidatus Woesearchaeota archaeon]